MGKITEQMKEIIENQKLGYVATVSPDKTPNLSPKGTLFVLNEEHLVFADIKSPKTISNLEANPAIEINVVDPISRKGYRFKGTSEIIADGTEFQEILSHYKSIGVKSTIKKIVKVKVLDSLEITSPLYDLGFSEEDIKKRWKNHYLSF